MIKIDKIMQKLKERAIYWHSTDGLRDMVSLDDVEEVLKEC